MSARDDLKPLLLGLNEHERNTLLDAFRAEVLSEQADDVVLFCPDHSNHYASYLSCHCPVADVLRQRAAKAAASSSGAAAGDKQPETDDAAGIKSALAVIAKHGDMSETVRQEIRDLIEAEVR